MRVEIGCRCGWRSAIEEDNGELAEAWAKSLYASHRAECIHALETVPLEFSGNEPKLPQLRPVPPTKKP